MRKRADVLLVERGLFSSRARAQEAIAAGLLRLLDDPGLGAELGRHARRRMERRFDARGWAENLRGLYEQVLARRHPRRGRP